MLLASMWLPRVEATSYEDFFGEFYGTYPPNGIREYGLPRSSAWFFARQTVIDLPLILASMACGYTAWLRPDIAKRRGFLLVTKALAACLVSWVLLTSVLVPGFTGIPVRRLPAAYLAVVSAVATSAGLLSLGVLSRTRGHDRRAPAGRR